MAKTRTQVLRVEFKVYSRLKALRKKDQTFSEVLSSVLDVAEKLDTEQTLFGAGGRLFTDVAEARGEAILFAVQNGVVPELPDVLVRIGVDDGV